MEHKGGNQGVAPLTTNLQFEETVAQLTPSKNIRFIEQSRTSAFSRLRAQVNYARFFTKKAFILLSFQSFLSSFHLVEVSLCYLVKSSYQWHSEVNF